MRYCWNCGRINPGKPLFCQYCGRTFGIRTCGRCRHINPKEALVCRNCGSPELSDTAGPLPSWMIFLRGLFWVFVLLAIVGCLLNLQLFIPLFLFVVLLMILYSFLPEILKKIIKFLLNLLKQRVFGKKEKS